MRVDKISLFYSLISNVVARSAQQLTAMLTAYLILEQLTVEDYGQFRLYLSFMAITSGLTLGTDKVLQRYVPECIESNERDAAATIFYSYSFARLVILVLVLSIATAVIGDITHSNASKYGIVLAILASICMSVSFLSITTLMTAFLDHKYVNSILTISSIIKTILVFALYAFRQVTIMHLLYAWSAAELFTAILTYRRVVSRLGKGLGQVAQHLKAMDLRRHLNYGKYFIAANLGARVLGIDIDNYFLTYYHGNTEVALYSVSARISTILQQFALTKSAFNISVPYLIHKYTTTGDTDELARPMSIFLKLNLLLWSVFTVFVFINSEFVLEKLFAGKYRDVTQYIAPWMLIGYLYIVKGVYDPISRAIEKSGVQLFYLYALILNLFGNLVLIPPMGISGAVFSTGVSTGVMVLLMYRSISTHVKLTLGKPFLFKSLLNVLILFGYMFWLRELLGVSVGYYGMAALNCTGAMLFAVTMMLNQPFSKGELRALKSWIPLPKVRGVRKEFK